MTTPRIPPILHQTWKDTALPAPLARYRQSWLTHHRAWEYRFYTDADCREEIRNAFPEWLPIYDGFSRPIQRVDLFRYLVVYRHGGLYADLDMDCLRPVDELLAGSACVLSVEAHITRRYQAELAYAEPLQVANCIFAAAPGHPFLARVLGQLRQRNASPAVTDGDVENSTGPRMLTRTYFSLDSDLKMQIRLLPQIRLMAPTCYPNIFPFNRKMHARHMCSGTWKTRSGPVSLKRRLIERNRMPRFW